MRPHKEDAGRGLKLEDMMEDSYGSHAGDGAHLCGRAYGGADEQQEDTSCQEKEPGQAALA